MPLSIEWYAYQVLELILPTPACLTQFSLISDRYFFLPELRSCHFVGLWTGLAYSYLDESGQAFTRLV
ncbi:hypothetical protein BVRB_8g194120 [Beta vulgaris subsp. vulgaris]|nr:hypothetical protein BVRB_8g194120 [Beta vulgaris subsp. vulgaris]